MKTITTACTIIATIGTLIQPCRTIAEEMQEQAEGAREGIEIVIVVDNYASRGGLDTTWGFSCLVRGFDKTILFDTGGDGALLLRNLKKLHIAPDEIDVVVLSHAHRDHTGGLDAFLETNPRVEIFLLASSPASLFEAIRKHGSTPVPVIGQTEICRDVYTTGALGSPVEEQSLVLCTPLGLTVITGCAHPGIVNILKKIKEAFPSSDIHLAMGGFHLLKSKQIKTIAIEIDAFGVDYIAPCHCSGIAAKRHFKRHFKNRFISIGAGARLKISKHPDRE